MHHILIVEDSPTMRSLVVSSLEDLGAPVRITEAASGFEALRELPRDDYDLIVTDINMPDINGLELISFLRQHPVYQKVPILIISTESAEEDRRRGLAIGANGYLTKPFTENDLVNLVQQLLP
ncbi:MAG TPA: response regulator [Myxococcota bacterium]|nr:response regulator [Myxococcota bacterium]